MNWRRSWRPRLLAVAALGLVVTMLTIGGQSSVVQAQAATVAIQDFRFDPVTLTVTTGTTVTWTNRGQAPHTVTSDTPGVWDSGILNNGGTFTFRFANAGTFAYHCTVHPEMKATIIAQAGAAAAAATGTATATPTRTATPTATPAGESITPAFRATTATPAAAQASPAAAASQPSPTPTAAPAPDMTRFGFPRVTATGNFTPGQALTVTAGSQKVELPANALSRPAKFEFLEGDVAMFQGLTTQYTVLATFAFRVTDTQTGQLIARFDNPVNYSMTDPRITPQSLVLNTTAANPPVLAPNAAPFTFQGQTASHPFAGTTVGWLTVNPRAGASATGGTTTTTAVTVSGGGAPAAGAAGAPAGQAGPVTALPRTGVEGATQAPFNTTAAAVLTVIVLLGAAGVVRLVRR